MKPSLRIPKPKATNKRKRKAATFNRAYGGEEYRTWVVSLPCVVCQKARMKQTTWTEPAHTRSGGMGRKADASTLAPICGMHHRELHQHGAETFATRWRIDLQAEAAKTAANWDRLNPPTETDDAE